MAVRDWFRRPARTQASLQDDHRTERALLQVLGPAAVDGALQGHSPEARAQWKRVVEAGRRARAEARDTAA